MNLADRCDGVVIDEVPAMGFNMFNHQEKIFRSDRINEKILATHLAALKELVDRDFNLPCVAMRSSGNEAATDEPESEPYFKAVAAATRKLDSSRPITLVQSSYDSEDRVAQHFDVVCGTDTIPGTRKPDGSI
jgi:beta-glucuronidase